MAKTCSKCNVLKNMSEFIKDKSKKDGYYSSCKKCNKERHKKYYIDNKEDLLEKQSIHYQKNKISKKVYAKKYRVKNKEKLKEQSNNYYILNKENIKVRRNKYLKKKRNEDLMFKFKGIIRTLVCQSLRNKTYTKNSRTFKIIGCSYKELLVHLNTNPYGFKYEDGHYDIDHIIPIYSAKTKEELLILNHYNNLQLLPSYYNRHIKRNKEFDKEDLENYLKLN